MSNMLAANGVPYFQMPKALFTEVYGKELSYGALSLLLYLHFRVQERSKVSVLISATDLRERLDMSGDTVLSARGQLEEAGLISHKRESAGYVYTLLNPETGKALLNAVKGDLPRFNLDDLTPDELERYFYHHTKGTKKRSGNQLTLCCPLHDDHKPSLTVDLDQGGTWFCHPCNKGGKLIAFERRVASSRQEEISATQALGRIKRVMESLGINTLSVGPLVATYPYRSTEGKMLFEVLRYKPKKFLQRHPDPNDPKRYVWNLSGVKKVLYNLPEIQDAEVVCVLEGEKDCDNLARVKLTSAGELTKSIAVTTCPGGANKWQRSYSTALKGKKVVIFPDNDSAGDGHAEQIESSLKGIAAEVRLRRFPEGIKDMTDFLEADGEKNLPQMIGEDWIFVPALI